MVSLSGGFPFPPLSSIFSVKSSSFFPSPRKDVRLAVDVSETGPGQSSPTAWALFCPIPLSYFLENLFTLRLRMLELDLFLR